MKFKFQDDGKVDIGLKKYILECIEEFGENLGASVASPVAKWLFTVDTKA